MTGRCHAPDAYGWRHRGVPVDDGANGRTTYALEMCSMGGRQELITHIERCRALLKVAREAVQKAVLADLVRYLEGRL
jgi:hypothetical protein